MRGLEIRMLTLDTTSLYAEDRGLQVPMTLEHGSIVGTQCCDNTVPRLVRPDPRVSQRIFPLDTFRSIGMDHTVFHKWIIKQTNTTTDKIHLYNTDYTISFRSVMTSTSGLSTSQR